MARPELIESLRDAAARDVQAVRDAACAAAGRRRAELEAELEQERRQLDEANATEARRVAAEQLAEAVLEARKASAAAADRLADRLLGLARNELPGLAAASRGRVFAALARELPPCRWQRVRVNPADEELAAEYFPDAVVEIDPAMSGGMEATRDDGRIAVSNSLETRLENAWPDLLPGMLAEIAATDSERGSPA